MKKQSFDFTKWLAASDSVSFTLFVGILFLFTSYQNVIHIVNPENTKDVLEYPFFIRVFISHLDSLFFALSTSIVMFQSKSDTQKVIYCTFEGIMIFLNFNRERLPSIFGITQETSIFLLVCYLALFSSFTFFILGTLAKEHRKSQALAEPSTRAEPKPSTQAEPQPEPSTQAPTLPTIDENLKKSYRNKYERLNKLGFDFPPPKKQKAGFKLTPKETQPTAQVQEEEKTKSNRGRKPIPAEVKQEIKKDLENGIGRNEVAKKHKVGKTSVTRIKEKQKF